MTADEIDSLRARLAEAERERDEARRATNDWHDEYVKMSETNLGNLGEFSKAKSAMRARIAEMEEGLRQALDQLNELGFASVGLDALLAKPPSERVG
jgi:uncharacterized coiled-coil DUF342 family protein